MEWLSDVWPLVTILCVFIALIGMLAWLCRCGHPNPHYRREVLCRDPMTGSDEVVEPAVYMCYDCGKTWRATVRDPAWAPTGIKQRFSGYDPALAAKPRWLVLNKVDLVPQVERERRIAQLVRRLRWQGPVFAISALAREGLQPLLRAVYGQVAQFQRRVSEPDPRFDEAGEAHG